MAKELSKTKIDKLRNISIRQIETCSKYKAPRLKQIRSSEEFYYGKERQSLDGIVIAPVPTMSGFVDTLSSKIDDAPQLDFGWRDLADYKRSKKTQSLWNLEASPNNGDWGLKDRWEKKLAIFEGLGISKIFAESDPHYKSYYEVKDLFNFIFEPRGGGRIKDHDFCGEGNIWLNVAQLRAGVKSEQYFSKAVEELIGSLDNSESKENNDLFEGQIERYSKLGFNMQENSYVGQKIARLNEHYMEYGGKRYKLLLDYASGIVIEAKLLKEAFNSNEWPYNVWHTYGDAFNFLSKAPADDVRPLASVMDRLISQALTNRERINMQHRGFNVDMIPDPSQLEWKQDGLVEIEVKKGQNIKDAVLEFNIKDLGKGTIDLVQFFKNMLGVETGVTAGAQGSSEEDKVGIHFSNMQQVADRLGLINKSYVGAYAKKGLKFFQGANEHLTDKVAVEMLGANGNQWEDCTVDDVHPISQFNITAQDGASEEQANIALMQTKKDALTDITNLDPNFEIMNKQTIIKEKLKLSGYDEVAISKIVNKDAIDLELLSEAQQSIEDILKGKEPGLNHGANIGFVKHILDYARDKIDFDDTKDDRKEKQKEIWHDQLVAYANDHISIVQKNANIMSITPPPAPAGGTPPPAPGVTPPTAEGQGRQFSQNASQALQGQPA